MHDLIPRITAKVPFRIPVTLRITYALRTAEGPQHYTAIAKRIKATRAVTQHTCARMARDGRLRWVAEGTYTLRPGPIPHPRPRRTMPQRRDRPTGPNTIACCGQWHAVTQIPFTVPCCQRVFALEEA